MDYADFLAAKQQGGADSGFEPTWLPEFLFPFQKMLTEWAIRKGRAAIFADCGLGKTICELVWSENVSRHTGKPVLILTPLAVSHQHIREAAKFGVEAARSEDGKVASRITVTNYERLHKFSPNDYGAVVCDESSILKNYDGKRRRQITEFMRKMPYRLLCTATAAPNDYIELGTSSEALGYLGHQDMLSRFFKEDVVKDYLGWGRKTYRFRGHAEVPFWRWVGSWARVCRTPSDVGFENDGFILPPLVEREHVIASITKRPGMLFDLPARDLQEQREERRRTLRERCAAAAELVESHDGPSVIWCHLNDEGDLLERMIPGAVQVAGSQSDDVKERRLLAFQDGEIKKLVIKPRIGCFGLNWQHCHNVVTFPSNSWESYYQSVRRCWRFGQEHQVNVEIITTEGELGVLRNLKRKALAADRMFSLLTQYANEALHLRQQYNGRKAAEVPKWL